MTKSDYYLECIKVSADEMDPPLILTEEQARWLADGVEGAIENEGMAFGYDCIPNPMIAVEEGHKKRLTEMDRDHTREVEKLRGVIEDQKREINRLAWRLEERR